MHFCLRCSRGDVNNANRHSVPVDSTCMAGFYETPLS